MMTRRRPFPFYNIETKTDPAFDGVFHPAPGEFVELLMGVIKEYQVEEMVTIQSFDFRTLKYLHEHYPSIKTSMLIESDDRRSFAEQIDALGFTPNVYSPEQSRVNASLVKECHKRNIRLIPWTVNDKARIRELQNLGVDGIITDFPNLFNE
jgi:glycerophosphoryl diester phosphodiesterase